MKNCYYFFYFCKFYYIFQTMKLDTSLGIRKFRERARYNTQTDLANALGINPQNVSFWEAGKGFPSYKIAKKLLELGAKVEEIFAIDYENIHGYKTGTNDSEVILNMLKELEAVKKDILDLKKAKTGGIK